MPPPGAINYLIITEIVTQIVSCTQSQNNGGLLFYLKSQEWWWHMPVELDQPGQYTMSLLKQEILKEVSNSPRK